ncbi:MULTISPECIES: IclR family transcriptional regulator [unclassified Cryobacterium]|uniref:IclR family transcriptional regulator n=1 Tax=unclassified Cryobacterium TaxID=2649013 RepID=UPI002AB3FBEF|nr:MULTISPECIES: IclR family transcriptional regulator [unclassified Cryobacterium]MDY7544594.1 IclR family transcriptional regulator [Cryobacterium sp. 5B3]MEB0000089.1 IclR family transcriptional regulator [Cryobacterium sp. RTS3]MEB0275968.1 IclR family transcriptional regulator [Cryobacterium sp. 5B3]
MTDSASTSDDVTSHLPGTQTLSRGLEVVRAVANGAMDLKAVCLATGIGRSTAHRLIQLLEQFGYLRSTHGADYSLGPTLIELGFQALYQSPASTVARPFLELLSKKYLDTIHLAIEEEGQVLYVDKIPGSRGAEMRSRIGYRMPLSQTGIGKALLLDSPSRWEDVFDREHYDLDAPQELRELFLRRMSSYAKQGSTLDLEENEPGIRCVAAPVHNGSGAIVAAISISAITPYMPAERMKALQPVLQQTALAISRKLGYSGPSSRTDRT